MSGLRINTNVAACVAMQAVQETAPTVTERLTITASPHPRMSSAVLGSIAAMMSVADSFGPSVGGGYGYRATPEMREARQAARLARAAKLLARAEAKRARKAEKRLSAVPSHD